MDTRRAARRVALGTVLLGAAAFVLIAAERVPWEIVPGGMPRPASASSVFTSSEIERAEHYARWARTWSWSSLAVSLAVACWLGFGRRGRAWAERVPGWWWVRIVLVVAALSVVGRLVTLPFAIALRRLALDEGLAAGTWSTWGVDVVKGELIAIVTTSLAVIALVACVRRWPRAWPAVAGVLGAALVVVGSFVYPVLIEPVFNHFEPLPDGSLRTAVLDLADQEGVQVDDVLVADASRRTTTLNAYVSGFGHTRRVVLYDTLVDGTPRDEVLSVVAHELAHARHGDVVTGTALGAAGALVGIGLLGLLLAGDGRRDLRRAGTVPCLLALVALATLASAPVQNGISRQLEARADQTALERTRDPQAFVALQRRLALRSHADPTPPVWSQFWFGSHPTVLQRIGLARAGAESAP
ncbi:MULTISPECIES: M48 family metallopeptidase [unclassified Nocardioides]|uniref:M48 family metallopeptidase n=1 Tax=unclassified Nocardioides TaxID=2615069 RepID=UPI000702B2D4|nr:MULTISPECIES: M48 family metallopeptidase [unclassified Nocardioides]KRC56750.1 peptidase M48 [Nocardioides sp. Root79]KRC76960.1 peptidase M48 [Nocardioides sp. Root240]